MNHQLAKEILTLQTHLVTSIVEFSRMGSVNQVPKLIQKYNDRVSGLTEYPELFVVEQKDTNALLSTLNWYCELGQEDKIELHDVWNSLVALTEVKNDDDEPETIRLTRRHHKLS